MGRVEEMLMRGVWTFRASSFCAISYSLSQPEYLTLYEFFSLGNLTWVNWAAAKGIE